ASAGLPFPALACAATIVIEIGGSLLLIAGFQARPVAAALALFAVATAISFHNNFSDQNQAIHFFKNLAIAGGLLLIVAAGEGRPANAIFLSLRALSHHQARPILTSSPDGHLQNCSRFGHRCHAAAMVHQ